MYVDETGQDTRGNLFIAVAIAVSGDNRDALIRSLESIEDSSGKGRRKWMKTRVRERHAYLDQALTRSRFPGQAYYQAFGEGGDYELRTAVVVAQAINLHVTHHGLTEYEATVLIDGFKRQEARRIAATLRKLGIKTRKVRGITDESNAAIRFADAIAGLAREVVEGNTALASFQERALTTRLLVKL